MQTYFDYGFHGRFINRFEPVGDETRFTIIAEISLKWPYRLLEPFLGPLVRRRLKNYVVSPLCRAATGPVRPMLGG